MPPDDSTRGAPHANPGYAAFQIARALTTSEQHGDLAIRERARAKAVKWTGVLEGLLSGQLAVGSRQPMVDAPVWATPEVVTGGFVTGQLLAGGPLRPHEKEIAARIGADGTDENRQQLNAWFLTGAGFAELAGRLGSGCYEIEVPEEAALLVAAWLAQNGAADEARDLVELIAPHFARLRFYPKPAQRPTPGGARIFLESVGTVLNRLRSMQPNSRILAQREAIQVWRPFYEKMVALFLETVIGEAPSIQPDSEGRWVSPETRRFYVTGDWPCRNYAADWRERARSTVAAIVQARAAHELCRRPTDAGDSFSSLLCYLRKCCDDPASLTGREVGMIRLILARYLARRGLPGSPQHESASVRQHAQVAKPLHHQVAGVVARRIEILPADAGLDDTADVLQPVTANEADQAGIAADTGIPASIARKVERCHCDTAEALIERGIVTSGETLARVIPQFTASQRAAAFDHPQLRALYAATYRAFRRRRSLLLFNLEKQVRIEELPWIAVIERRRRQDLTSRDLSRQTLQDVAAVTLRAFPQSIIPNKLLQEFRALAKGGELSLPFVEELAADIFMDDFSPKFTQAAKQAATYVDGTLYARYYGLDCAAVLRLPDPKPGPRRWSWFNREAPTNPFAALCIQRAAAAEGMPRDVARNGMVIEQSQILTTHNLALLFGVLELEAELRPELRDMAERCFHWLCRRQQVRSDKWHAKLIMLKQTAYAWRQMIFFLSRLPHEEAGQFIGWAEAYLQGQSTDFHSRFIPALRGLALVHGGGSLDGSEQTRRFLGWTQARHWLLADEPPKRAQ
jgi:hypothetical protein